MTVSLSEVLASARARSAPLAGECAGYLVLAAADHAARGPRRIEAGSVELHPDGSVRVVGGLPSNEATTERDLRELLDELLLVAGSVTPGLLRAARRRTGAGIDGFVREIETALIPVNRAAARRALARLERETSRAVERGALVIENQRRSDAALSPELPVAAAPPPASPTPPPPVSVAPPPASPTPPPPVSVTPPPVALTSAPSVSVTPPPVALTSAPPVSVTPPPVASSPVSRPASDLAPTPVAVPVRAKLALPLPVLEETPSRFETRPETVVARASRPPAKPSALPAPVLEPPVPATYVSLSPSARGLCTPAPPESMTPFLGTATAQRLSSLPAPIEVPRAEISPAVAGADEEELDVPIDVEMPVEPAVSAASLEDVAEDDIVEESPDELTEPFYLDGDGGDDVGPLAFHELTALTSSVAPMSEPVIELAQSPTPAPEVSAEEVIVAHMEDAPGVGEVVAPAAEASGAEEIVAPAAEASGAEEIVAPVAEASGVEEVVAPAAEAARAEEIVAPAAEASGAEEIVAPVAEAPGVEEIVALAEDVPNPGADAHEADCAPPVAVEEKPVEVEAKRGEFDDVELAVLLPSAEPPPVILRKALIDPADLLPRRPLPRQTTSNVDELLLSFGDGPSESGDEQDVRSTLKRLAGLELTPPPGPSRD